MSNTPGTASPVDESTIGALIIKARAHRRNPNQPFSNTLSEVQSELRRRRQGFLGSAVPLSRIVYDGNELDYSAASELSEYLSIRATALWGKPHEESLRLCRQFFELCMVLPQWYLLDDIIFLASILTHYSKVIFLDVMTSIVDEQYHILANSFTSDYYAFCPQDSSFEDAVLGAVAILLGVLSDMEVDK